jgi:hypothetical protein
VSSPNAQYVIDIAASMPEGEATIAELDKLTASLMGGGKNAEFFQQAIQQTGAALDSARAASEAANKVLGEGQAEYSQLEKAAVNASKAQERLAARGDTSSAKYIEAAKRAADAQTAVDGYAATLKTLETNAAAATAKEESLNKTLGNVKKLGGHVDKSLLGNAESLEKLRGSLSAVGGPAGRLGSQLLAPVQGFSKLEAAMGSTSAAAIVGVTALAALAVAVVAVGVAFAVAVVKVAAWAVGLADANRSAALTQEGVEALDPAIAGLGGRLGDIAKATGLTTPTLDGLAKSLEEAGTKAEDLGGQLKIAALAEAAVGKEGSAQFLKLVSAANAARKAVEDAAKGGGVVSKSLTDKFAAANSAVDSFATTAQTKLGGIVSRQLLGLEAQSNRFQKRISEVFGGLDIDPVLSGLERLSALFDKNEASGKALKFLFEKFFQPIIDSAENASYVVEAFALGFEIGLVKLYIKLKPAIKAISEFFGFESPELADTLETAKTIGEEIAPVFAALAVVVGGVLAVAFAAVGVVVAAQVAVWYTLYKAIGVLWDEVKAVGSGIAGVASAIGDAFTGVIQPVIDWFTGKIDLTEAASRIMMGIVDGITGVAGAVFDAFVGVWTPILSAIGGIASTIWSAVAAIFPGVTGAISSAAGSVLGAFTGLWGHVTSWFAGISLVDIGKNLILGLASGITGAAGAVVNAISGAVSGAISTAKSLLGIHSPSKVFADIGDDTGQGFVGGVEDTTDQAHAAIATMADPNEALKQAQGAGDVATVERLMGGAASIPSPADGNASGGPAAVEGAADKGPSAPGKPGATINFNAPVYFGGKRATQSEIDQLSELITRSLEGDVAALGGADVEASS